MNFKRVQNIRPADELYDLVFVGRLASHKRVDMLLKALRLLETDTPDARYAIVGDGPERPRLEKLAS